ncbi:hypothetical protein BIY29_03415 [Brenneria alni]|uniref:Uncharacterized protein n=1 Tax=Brenneria alni TaxID=71656 RepID=A0A421DSH5_9GAMM|nr:hypothetical protein BIY29_03415 [Brenneria alni]
MRMRYALIFGPADVSHMMEDMHCLYESDSGKNTVLRQIACVESKMRASPSSCATPLGLRQK